MFGIALYNPKRYTNVGSLLRTADLLGASYFCTIGNRYKRQSSDTMHSTKNVPTFEYNDFESFRANLPKMNLLVAIELADGAKPLRYFSHPKNACYLFGAEDSGIPERIVDACHDCVVLPGDYSMNLSCCGSIVIWDRFLKAG